MRVSTYRNVTRTLCAALVCSTFSCSIEGSDEGTPLKATTVRGLTTTSVTGAAVAPNSVAEIQSFLDSAFYKDTDITRSFHTIFAEQVDCINFDAQPTVSA